MTEIRRVFVLGMFAGAAVFAAGLSLGGLAGSPINREWGSQRGPAAQEPQVSDSIRTRRLEIVDELGTTVLIAGVNDFGGSLSIRNRFGKPALVAALTAEGAQMAISNPSSDHAAALIAASEQGGSASFFSAAGRALVEIKPEVDGALFAMHQANGAPAATLRSENESGGALTAFSHQGTVATRIYSDVEGGGVVETYRASGAPLAAMSSTQGGHGQISTYAGLGRTLVQLTATANHEGQIYTYNADGLPLIALATSPRTAESKGGPTLRLFNLDGDPIITLESDDAGQGAVGIWDRKGMGRTLGP